MKVGDLVRVDAYELPASGQVGLIVQMVSFETGKNPQPIVLLNGKRKLFGAQVCEVLNESR